MLAAVGVARGGYFAVVAEVHLVYMLRCVVGGHWLVVGAEHLSPDVCVALVLKQICHFAALQLLLRYLRALLIAAGVEVVAVVEGGAGVGGEGP